MEEHEEQGAWETQGDGAGPETAELHSADGPSPASPSSARRSRRAAQKKVVTIPVGATEGFRHKNGAGGEVFPPTDSWAWRKYGQKPIKGSPHPRGYYRCSSCKGCPARKQVERSHAEPGMLVVTYSFEHNHPWPLPKHGRYHQQAPPPPPPLEDPAPPPRKSAIETEEKSPPAIQEREPPPVLAIDDGGFGWFSDVASPSSTSAGSDELLYGSVHFGSPDALAGLMVQEEREAAAAEEDSLFAGLGELPEYSVVLRRGLAAAPWAGTTG